MSAKLSSARYLHFYKVSIPIFDQLQWSKGMNSLFPSINYKLSNYNNINVNSILLVMNYRRFRFSFVASTFSKRHDQLPCCHQSLNNVIIKK